MRWGSRKQRAPCVEQDAGEKGDKGKGRAFSFSPLSWLAKLTAKEKRAAAAFLPSKNSGVAPPPAAPAFPSCLPKRTSPSPVVATPGRHCSPPRRSHGGADVVPRRLSVGNDSAVRTVAARRHCSLGGDHELPSLGHLIPFSHAGSPPRPPTTTATPGNTDAPAARTRRRRRRSHRRRLSISGRRPSFSGRVRVRPAAAPGLEPLAVVRRTRDPQRAFRESMVEMIASGGPAPPPPEELERLLACYLSLNADEHHDCIVKVFRQVLFEHANLLPYDPDARR